MDADSSRGSRRVTGRGDGVNFNIRLQVNSSISVSVQPPFLIFVNYELVQCINILLFRNIRI